MRIFISSLGLLLLLLSCVTQATEDQITFQSEQQKLIYQEVTVELRCPRCQNQNIVDSNAVVAKDMRVKVKALLDEGNNKQQIIDYMVNRYGQFVHYQPPFNVATSLLWLLPIGFILFAMFVQVSRSKSKSETIEVQASPAELDAELAHLLVDTSDVEASESSPTNEKHEKETSGIQKTSNTNLDKTTDNIGDKK